MYVTVEKMLSPKIDSLESPTMETTAGDVFTLVYVDSACAWLLPISLFIAASIPLNAYV